MADYDIRSAQIVDAFKDKLSPTDQEKLRGLILDELRAVETLEWMRVMARVTDDAMKLRQLNSLSEEPSDARNTAIEVLEKITDEMRHRY